MTVKFEIRDRQIFRVVEEPLDYKNAKQTEEYAVWMANQERKPIGRKPKSKAEDKK